MEDEKEKKKKGRPKIYITEEERRAANTEIKRRYRERNRERLRELNRESYLRRRERHNEQRRRKYMLDKLSDPQTQLSSKDKAVATLAIPAKWTDTQARDKQERRASDAMAEKRRAKVLAGLPESVRVHVAALARIKEESKNENKNENKNGSITKQKRKSNGNKRDNSKQT